MNRVTRMTAFARTMSLLLVVTLGIPSTTPTALAQSSKGIVVGTITDPAGAVISSGTVKVTNTATNVSRETVIAGDGTFRLDAVDPGTYKIEVKAGGFKVAQRDAVIVAAAQTTDTSFALEVGGGWTLAGIYRIQSGSVETPFISGIDLNGDLNAFNDRPTISNPNAPPTSVAFARSVLGLSGSSFVDVNGNPVNPANTRYLVDPNNRKNIAGRNTLRGERVNNFDASVNKAFKLPFEGHKLEVRVEFFNVLNHPNFTFANPIISSDQSNGDVTNPFFNNVRLNDGGNRTGRIQVRYVF